MQRAQLIRKLVLDSQYVVDEDLVATAIVVRARVRRLVADAAFRNECREPRVRSFRPTKQARSFRPFNVSMSGDPHLTALRRHSG
jgi:hypothetical protein